MSQTDREAINAILHYENFSRVPILHFGFWTSTLQKWAKEGHISAEELSEIITGGLIIDGNPAEKNLAQRLGFDDSILVMVSQKGRFFEFPLFPHFEEKIIERYENGSYKMLNKDGVYVLCKDDVTSISAEIEHILTDRTSWEEHYMPRLQWTEERVDKEQLQMHVNENETRDRYTALYGGSLYGKLRNYWGIVGISYLQVDDYGLLKECADAVGDISYKWMEYAYNSGLRPDFVHFWEDICYRSGSLVNPDIFRDLTGRHYRRLADLSGRYGVDILTVDCDGFIEDLVPIWLDNGVNTMLPIEVGAWEYDFSTMRKKFGKEVLGIGNVNKGVFAKDRKAVDAEVERIKRVVELGGFVPCPDHRIAEDAEWDLVKYYCEKMREAFS